MTKYNNDKSKKSTAPVPVQRKSTRGQSPPKNKDTSTAATAKGDNTTPAVINATANTANAAAADTAGTDNTPKAKSSGVSKTPTPININKVTPLDDAISEESQTISPLMSSTRTQGDIHDRLDDVCKHVYMDIHPSLLSIMVFADVVSTNRVGKQSAVEKNNSDCALQFAIPSVNHNHYNRDTANGIVLTIAGNYIDGKKNYPYERQFATDYDQKYGDDTKQMMVYNQGKDPTEEDLDVYQVKHFTSIPAEKAKLIYHRPPSPRGGDFDADWGKNNLTRLKEKWPDYFEQDIRTKDGKKYIAQAQQFLPQWENKCKDHDDSTPECQKNWDFLVCKAKHGNTPVRNNPVVTFARLMKIGPIEGMHRAGATIEFMLGSPIQSGSIIKKWGLFTTETFLQAGTVTLSDEVEVEDALNFNFVSECIEPILSKTRKCKFFDMKSRMPFYYACQSPTTLKIKDVLETCVKVSEAVSNAKRNSAHKNIGGLLYDWCGNLLNIKEDNLQHRPDIDEKKHYFNRVVNDSKKQFETKYETNYRSESAANPALDFLYDYKWEQYCGDPFNGIYLRNVMQHFKYKAIDDGDVELCPPFIHSYESLAKDMPEEKDEGVKEDRLTTMHINSLVFFPQILAMLYAERYNRPMSTIVEDETLKQLNLYATRYTALQMNNASTQINGAMDHCDTYDKLHYSEFYTLGSNDIIGAASMIIDLMNVALIHPNENVVVDEYDEDKEDITLLRENIIVLQSAVSNLAKKGEFVVVINDVIRNLAILSAANKEAVSNLRTITQKTKDQKARQMKMPNYEHLMYQNSTAAILQILAVYGLFPTMKRNSNEVSRQLTNIEHYLSTKVDENKSGNNSTTNGKNDFKEMMDIVKQTMSNATARRMPMTHFDPGKGEVSVLTPLLLMYIKQLQQSDTSNLREAPLHRIGYLIGKAGTSNVHPYEVHVITPKDTQKYDHAMKEWNKKAASDKKAASTESTGNDNTKPSLTSTEIESIGDLKIVSRRNRKICVDIWVIAAGLFNPIDSSKKKVIKEQLKQWKIKFPEQHVKLAVAMVREESKTIKKKTKTGKRKAQSQKQIAPTQKTKYTRISCSLARVYQLLTNKAPSGADDADNDETMSDLDKARDELISAVNDLHDEESSESKYSDLNQYLKMNDEKWCAEDRVKTRFANPESVFTFLKEKVTDSDKHFTHEPVNLRNLQVGMLITSTFNEDVDLLKDDFLVLKLKKPKSSVRMWSIFHDKKVQGAKIKKWEKEFTEALRECADNEWTNLDYFETICPGDLLTLWKEANSILIGRKQKHTALTDKYCDPGDKDNEEESESSMSGGE